jgi:hypothetical protein
MTRTSANRGIERKGEARRTPDEWKTVGTVPAPVLLALLGLLNAWVMLLTVPKVLVGLSPTLLVGLSIVLVGLSTVLVGPSTVLAVGDVISFGTGATPAAVVGSTEPSVEVGLPAGISGEDEVSTGEPPPPLADVVPEFVPPAPFGTQTSFILLEVTRPLPSSCTETFWQ